MRYFFDPAGTAIAIVTLIFSYIWFFRETAEIFESFEAALIAALWAWGTYVILRWLFLTFYGYRK